MTFLPVSLAFNVADNDLSFLVKFSIALRLKGCCFNAELMEFTDRLISKIELFYDASLFQEKKSEIFEDGN